ncbi:hypothetical protein I302_104933 [Kwoniella bestiolae CBS 10118]|uniref:Major facilitator superfamily (MFS) profile domain-containing protein n=1 Tax=Kwoniella bestiolae CBS 10118 TaxID=1296100 RepID=A0A1B9FRE5_9TREE|nr:hypothetical protein I302_08996 [Kwoniella bestiolae CBS 10118]OCF21322.1 hypothetical protein I302_08996 [Kwoniella bestiolae CBS 10118]
MSAPTQAHAELERMDSKKDEVYTTSADAEGVHKLGEGYIDHTTAFAGLSRIQAMRKFWRACTFCMITAFGVIMDGYQTSLPGSVLANSGFIKQFGTVVNPTTGNVSVNAQYISMWSGLAYLCQFLGNWAGGFISDRFGRRYTLYALTVVFTGGIITEIVARNYKDWLAAKMLMGLGQGLIQQGVLTYISEVAPTQLRGALMSTYGWAYALGQLFVAIALNTLNMTDPENYLKAIYSEFVFLGLWIIALPFLPETPWYYARKEDEVSAKKTLHKIYKGVEGYDIDREYNAMLVEIQEEKQKSHSNSEVALKDIFMGPHLRRTFASVFALVMQNWSGSPIIFNYTTYFLQQAGLPEPFQASVIVYCILIFSLMVSFYGIERLGRRTLILSGGLACTVFNVAIASLGFAKKSSSVDSATLAFICLWVFMYAFGFAGTGWTCAAEIATPRLRAKTTAFAASTNAISGAIFNSTVPLMISATSRNWGVKTLYMFAILGGVGTVINFFLLPETKGRTFAELDEMYDLKISPRKMKAHVTTLEESGLKQHK